MFLRLLLLLLCCWSGPFAVWAQFPGSGSNSGSGRSTPQETYVEVVDTFGTYYFFVDHPNEEYFFDDTLLTEFEIYETIRQRDMEYADLGNPGSPHQPLFFQPSFRKGVDIGLHQFDLYELHRENSPSYRLERPLTRAFFSQNNSTNLSFRGEFSRNFTGGLNTSVTAFRTNHTGQYQNQRARNTAFANNWWYHDKNGRYDAFFLINSNSHYHFDNGGIDTSRLSPPYSNPVTIPVFINNEIATTRHTHRELSYTQYYKIIGADNPASKNNNTLPKPNAPRRDGRPALPSTPPDSLALPLPPLPDTTDLPLVVDSLSQGFGEVITMNGDTIRGQVMRELEPPPPLIDAQSFSSKRVVALGHSFSYKSSRYRSSDTNPDTSFYDDKFYTLANGLRQAFHHQRIANDFNINMYQLRDDVKKIRKEKDLLQIGLTHTWHRVEQAPEKNNYHNLFLHGRFNYHPGNRLRLETYLHYGLLKNLADYRAQGKLAYQLPRLGTLEIELIQQAYEPSLISERLLVSETLVWENDFKKIFETTLNATYRLPQFGLEISGQYHLINNFLYYDTDKMPQQSGSAINVGQLMLKKNITFWQLHLDNTIILQQTSNDLLRLPQIFTKQSFYFTGYLFKRSLFTHIGMDFRMTDDFRANTYFALTGQFHQQNSAVSKAYPLLDVFVNFKVQQFRFFAKYENLTKLWEEDLYVITPGYPQRFEGFRFGVSWRFLN